MKEIEILATSPDEARDLVAAKLNIHRNNLEVIEEYEPDEQDLADHVKENNLDAPPSKDSLSLFVVSVSSNHYVDAAQNWTQGLIERFAPGATAEAVRFRHLIIIRLSVPESSILIGKQGATLDALQHIVVRALLTKDESFPDIMLDVERYREKKLIRLEKEAKRAADKAARTGRKVPLSPMSPAERKFVHNCIKDIEGIKTESRGKDRERHVVVESTLPPPRRQGGGAGGGQRRGYGGGAGAGGGGGYSRGGGGGNPNRERDGNRAGGGGGGRDGNRDNVGNRDHGNRDNVGNRDHGNRDHSQGNRQGGPNRGGGGGNRGNQGGGNRGNQAPLTDADRQRLYGNMKERYQDSELKASEKLLPKFFDEELPGQATSATENVHFEDEIE